MRKILQVILLLAGLGAALWLYRQFFPPEEVVIERRLQALAHIATFNSREGDMARLLNVNQMADFFSNDVVVRLSGAHPEFGNLAGRDGLRQVILAARTSLQRMRVRFPDILVALGPDGQSSTANVTVVADINSEQNAVLQELAIELRKNDGLWRIVRVETLKALDR